MTNFIIRLFIKNKSDDFQKIRSAHITAATVVGIFLNFLLFIFKIVFGILAGSMAMIADAFNNITDAGSSLVSFIGFRLSIKHVDKKHPFGHGRMEYVAGFIVDMLIILVGFELLKSSVQKIFSPSVPETNVFTLIILVASVLIKLWLFFFYRKIGKKIDSVGLRSTAIDSLTDCAATTLVLISVIVSKQFNIMIDGYVGIFVSALILWAGIKAAKETMDLLLGAPPTKEYIDSIYEYTRRYPQIIGIHDLMVHDYGVGRKFISFHAEMSEDYNINYAHEIVDQLEREMNEIFGALVTIHFDPIAVNNDEVDRMRLFAIKCMNEVNEKFTLHDFRMTKGEKNINLIFDMVIPIDYSASDDDAAKQVADKIKEYDPNCYAVIQPEHPFY